MNSLKYEVEKLPPRKDNPKFEKNYVGDQMPYMWKVYTGTKIHTYGYAHTEEQATEIASKAYKELSDRNA